ncbi:MAG: regulator of protease activity HflC (stomatin/prohibitin superfamily) [Cellvibrionaceae bacterium]|jgi:regulator of protease activity HflC (stomatin/prohibitin superfamily)
MLLDQTLDIFTKSSWIIFILALLIYFFRTLFEQGLGAALSALIERWVLIGLLIVLSITTLSLSLVFVEPQNVGVVVSIISPAGIRQEPERSGVRWVFPFAEEVHTYPIYWQTYTMSAKPLEGQQVGDDSIRARTYDGQEVIIDCSLIFRLETEQVVRIHVDWQSRYIEDFIRPYVRGIVRTEVSQFTIDEVNSFKRRDLEVRLEELLREEFADKGFILDKFLLRNIAFTSVYAASVEQKQVALQEITQSQHQANQVRQYAQGEADKQIIFAKAEATSISIVAEAQAEALATIAAAVENQPDLLTYEYIEKIAPNVNVMLLPSENPFILTLPSLEESLSTPREEIEETETAEEAPVPTATPLASPTPTSEP